MNPYILQCPLLHLCRSSMARVCACEMLAQQVTHGALTVIKPKVAGAS